jgi:hypothetical protein
MARTRRCVAQALGRGRGHWAACRSRLPLFGVRGMTATAAVTQGGAAREGQSTGNPVGQWLSGGLAYEAARVAAGWDDAPGWRRPPL